MAGKILLNIFFNIAILTLVLCGIWLFNNDKYALLAAVLFGLALFIFFKIRLMKNVRAHYRNKR